MAALLARLSRLLAPNAVRRPPVSFPHFPPCTPPFVPLKARIGP
jgi:hypothetical protein